MIPFLVVVREPLWRRRTVQANNSTPSINARDKSSWFPIRARDRLVRVDRGREKKARDQKEGGSGLCCRDGKAKLGRGGDKKTRRENARVGGRL